MIEFALHDPVFAVIGVIAVALLLVVTASAIACAFMRGASERTGTTPAPSDDEPPF